MWTHRKLKPEKYFLLLSIFLFFLPIFQRVSVFSIIVMALVWLVTGDWRNSFSEWRRDKKLYFFILYYTACVAGMFYSSNLSFGFADLQMKFAFLLFPIMIPGLG